MYIFFMAFSCLLFYLPQGKHLHCILQGFTGRLAFAIAACVLGSSFMFGYNTGVVNTSEEVI
jgi:hypothetical protein